MLDLVNNGWDVSSVRPLISPNLRPAPGFGNQSSRGNNRSNNSNKGNNAFTPVPTSNNGGMTIPGMSASPRSINRNVLENTPNLPNFSGFGKTPSGTWASGGFNTIGMPSQTGWMSDNSSFSNNSFIPGMPAFQAPGLPGVGNANNPFGFTGHGTGASFNPINFPGLPSIGTHDLEKLYGKDIGRALSQFLSSGAGFNPAVMQAELNQALPVEERNVAKMMDIFGTTGNAYSSTAALGVGDFESQFNAAMNEQFAQQYQQSIQNYLSVLKGIAPGAQQQQAQKPNWWNIGSEIFNTIMPFAMSAFSSMNSPKNQGVGVTYPTFPTLNIPGVNIGAVNA